MIEKTFNRPNIEKFPKGISILRNADYAKCRSKFKKRFVQKIIDWIPLKEKDPKKTQLTETCRTILIKYFHWRYWIIACSFWLTSNYHALFSKCRFLWENNLQLLWLLALMKNKQSSVCKSTEPSRPFRKKITSESCLFSQWHQSNIQGVLLTHAKTLEVYTRGQK